MSPGETNPTPATALSTFLRRAQRALREVLGSWHRKRRPEHSATEPLKHPVKDCFWPSCKTSLGAILGQKNHRASVTFQHAAHDAGSAAGRSLISKHDVVGNFLATRRCYDFSVHSKNNALVRTSAVTLGTEVNVCRRAVLEK